MAIIGSEDLRRIAHDPDAFGAFYLRHVEDVLARMHARIDAAAQARELYGALDELPDAQRALLELTALDGLSAAEAARAVGVHPVTARVTLHRARAAMRDALAGGSSTPTPQPTEASS